MSNITVNLLMVCLHSRSVIPQYAVPTLLHAHPRWVLALTLNKHCLNDRNNFCALHCLQTAYLVAAWLQTRSAGELIHGASAEVIHC